MEVDGNYLKHSVCSYWAAPSVDVQQSGNQL